MVLALFFIARFLFYSYAPSDELTFGHPDSFIRQFDLIFLIAGAMFSVGKLKISKKLNLIKRLLISVPIVFIIPFLFFAYTTRGNPDLNTGSWYLVADLFFLLYTVIFSWTLAIDFNKSGRSVEEFIWFLIINILILMGLLNLQIENIYTNTLHTLPFLWASIRFQPKPKS